MTLRSRLIAAFLASTLLPLVATVWITTSLLDRSLRYATTGELDRLSRTLETTAKQFYQRERDALKQDALAGRTRPTTYVMSNAGEWPESIRSFWESGEPEGFAVSGASGERVDYMRRMDNQGGRPGVEIYARPGRRQHGTTVHPGSRNAPPRGRDRCARPAAGIHADALLVLLGAPGSSRYCRWS